MYKDKEKQREANRRAQAKFKAKGITEGITAQNCNAIPGPKVIPKSEQRTGINSMIKPSPDFKPKRGKDIKCFEDLPPDVQQAIDDISLVDGKIDKILKANRTAIAISYQHTFGAGAYYPHGAVCTGIVTGKPGDAGYNGICTEAWRAERGR